MGTKNNPGKFDCYANAGDDEPMFILLGRDPHAHAAVRKWAKDREAMIFAGLKPETDSHMVKEARECADAMEQYAIAWQHRKPGEPPMTPTDTDRERAAPWCQDAWFVLTISGDGQGTSLHHGWEAICDALVAAHYFKPDDDQRAEVIARFTDWEIWESVGGYPWRWLSHYEDGAVSVERVTDGAALAEARRGAGWQPIETAPKDWSLLILGGKGWRKPGRWAEANWVGVGDPKWITLDGHGLPPVTHWQPFPEPPALAAPDQGGADARE